MTTELNISVLRGYSASMLNAAHDDLATYTRLRATHDVSSADLYLERSNAQLDVVHLLNILLIDETGVTSPDASRVVTYLVDMIDRLSTAAKAQRNYLYEVEYLYAAQMLEYRIESLQASINLLRFMKGADTIEKVTS